MKDYFGGLVYGLAFIKTFAFAYKWGILASPNIGKYKDMVKDNIFLSGGVAYESTELP